MLDLEQRHPLLQEVRVTPLGEVDLLVQREDPGFPGSAVAGPSHRELAEEREVVPPSQLRLPRQKHAVGPRDGRSHIARPSLSKVQLHRCQADGQQPLEDTLLGFVRLERAGVFPDKLQQRLEGLLSFRDTHLDIERVHGILLTWQNIGTLRGCSQVSTIDGGSLAPGKCLPVPLYA